MICHHMETILYEFGDNLFQHIPLVMMLRMMMGEDVKQLWDEKLHEFHKGVVEHAAKLKRQQIGSLQAFRQRMAAKTPVKPQWSRELLKHRKVQVN